jgi:PAS domain-containing protein
MGWCRVNTGSNAMEIQMPALRIAIIYLLFGALWIYLSDNFLGVQITDPELLTQYQTYKGWFYVLITALLAYLLVAQALRRQSAAETSLHDSEARFQTIFDNVNDIILLRDADTGKIVEANAKALEQLGYSRDECADSASPTSAPTFRPIPRRAR